MAAMLQFRVIVQNEDDETAATYFKELETIFVGIVNLSAFGYDTPFTETVLEKID